MRQHMAKKTAAKSAAKPRSRGSKSSAKSGTTAKAGAAKAKAEGAPFEADGGAGGTKAAAKAPPKAGVGGKRSVRSYKSAYVPGSGKDRHLVIVESPSKAKTTTAAAARPVTSHGLRFLAVAAAAGWVGPAAAGRAGPRGDVH